MKVIIFFTILLCFGCNRSKNIDYDDNTLRKFVNDSAHFDVTDRNNYLIIILQNEDCVCTEEHISFAEKFFKSSKYNNFKKLLLIGSKTHPILKRVTNKDVNIFLAPPTMLVKNGVFIVSDRFFLYKNRNLIEASDMKNYTKELESKYF